jgi:hypothetical protein
MENNIPSAEEFARREYEDRRSSEQFLEKQIDMKHALFMMQEFAKLHVQEALKYALEEVPYGGSDEIHYEHVKGILTCYPLENIK